MLRLLTIAFVIGISLQSTLNAASPYAFQGLGVSASAAVISADGTTVVGGDMWLWTQSTGVKELPTPTNGTYFEANSISGDGSIVGGTIQNGQTSTAAIWSASTGYQSASTGFQSSDSSIGTALSRDGSRLGGSDISSQQSFFPPYGHDSYPYAWSSASGVQNIPFANGADAYSISVTSMSADGSVIAGQDKNLFESSEGGPFVSTVSAYYYSKATGFVVLDNGTSGVTSQALGVSGPGTLIVGSRHASGQIDTAYIWTIGGSGHSLGSLTNGDSSAGLAISDDGSTAVGWSGSEAVLWRFGNQPISIEDFLTSHNVTGLTGWTLQEATSVSADGRTIVGLGISPGGTQEAWIATVPEPSSLALGCLMMVGLFVAAAARCL